MTSRCSSHGVGAGFRALVGFAVAFLGVASVAAAEEPAEAQEVSYAREVQPILASACFACHGRDPDSREAELRLDNADDAFAEREGDPAIVPGDPDGSAMFQRLTAEDPADRMPPQSHHVQPTDEEIRTIRRWIEQGAEYEPHWAFTAPEKVALPEVDNADWPRNAIDRFVLARLEEEGLTPSPEADRQTLIRRVSLDLTGLPPTPEQVERFVNDTDPEAYERLVDRLLASDRYGEHMTKYWLDAVRYGDTHGLHLDNYREMWPYRDWVIRAFNDNKPYDTFTIEQLAGDLLPDPTLDQKIASGFNRAHVTTNEGGSIKDEVFMRNVADRSETAATVFLGLTMGCAQCHDHKFDPISMEEYYAFYAFFNSLDGNPMDGNAAQHPPVVRVPSDEQQEKLAELDDAIAATNADRQQRRKEAGDAFATWVEQAPETWAEQHDVHGSAVARFRLNENGGDTVASAVGAHEGVIHGEPAWETSNVPDGQPAMKFDGQTYVEVEGVGDFERDQPFSYGAWVYTNQGGAATVVSRMNAGSGHRGWDMYLSNRRVMVHLIHQWPDNAIRLNTKQPLEAGKWQQVTVTYDGSSSAEGFRIYVDGEPAEVDVTHDALSDTVRSEAHFRIGKRTDDTPLRDGMVADVVLFDRALSADDVATLAGGDTIGPILATAEDERTDEQRQQLRDYYFDNVDERYRALRDKLADLRKQRDQLHESLPTTLVYQETDEPRQARIMQRGMYDAPGDPVERGLPEALPDLPEDAPVDRLGLARWLVSDRQPLTARVTVNRFWQQVFGIGIVKTAEDFGTQGEMPSHPDLLDYLAVDFRENGWDVKRLMRQIVLSATYRQQSARSPEQQQRDPENRLLARGPRFRLDAEVLRDQALAVSGLLVEQIGGPGVKPPQPEGLWNAVGYSSSNTANFEADTGRENVHRRSLYTFWKRTSPPPQMTVFDAPSRESCIMRRERTNTPLQALALMNDVQLVEPARALAELTMQQPDLSAEQRVVWLFRRVTTRRPDAFEQQEVLQLYQDYAADYADDPEAAAALVEVGETDPAAELDRPELAAWTMVANLLLNLDEVINKN